MDNWNNLKLDRGLRELWSVVMTLKLFTFNEFIENRLPEAHIDSEEISKLLSKTHWSTLTHLEPFFVSCITVEKTYQEHDFIQNALLKSQSKSIHQMTIKNYFN